MRRKLRVGVVGTGRISLDRHIPNYLKSHDVELVAIADPLVSSLNLAGDRFGIGARYYSYKKMIDTEKLDIISICTPNVFHKDMVIYALEHGINVLCEKPLGLNESEIIEMREASIKNNKLLSVGHHYRYMPEVWAAKKIIDSGEIGKPYIVRVQALRNRGIPTWGVFHKKKYQGGGALIDYGIHLLDVALWLTGNRKLIKVNAFSSSHIAKRDDVNPWGQWNKEEFDVEDHITAQLVFEDNLIMNLEVAWAVNIPETRNTLSISGIEGGVEVFPFELFKPKHGMLFNCGASYIPGDRVDPGEALISDFINAVKEGRQTRVKLEEVLHLAKVIDSIYENADSK